MAALGFPSAAYDRWKTTEPEPRPACDICGEALGLEPGDTIRVPGEDELLCSYRCESVYLARQATDPRLVMQHVADALSAGADLRVHALLQGGGRTARGPVVDWSVDGRQLVIENETSGCDCTVRVDNVRRVEVLP